MHPFIKFKSTHGTLTTSSHKHPEACRARLPTAFSTQVRGMSWVCVRTVSVRGLLSQCSGGRRGTTSRDHAPSARTGHTTGGQDRHPAVTRGAASPTPAVTCTGGTDRPWACRAPHAGRLRRARPGGAGPRRAALRPRVCNALHASRVRHAGSAPADRPGQRPAWRRHDGAGAHQAQGRCLGPCWAPCRAPCRGWLAPCGCAPFRAPDRAPDRAPCRAPCAKLPGPLREQTRGRHG